MTSRPPDEYQPDVGPDPDLDAMRLRLARLLDSVDTYTYNFDPYVPELVESLLSDDLTSIATDLANGLRHFRAGDVAEALWWWQFSYVATWGNIASAVLRALQSVVAHDRLDSDFEDETEQILAAEAVLDAIRTVETTCADRAVESSSVPGPAIEPPAGRTEQGEERSTVGIVVQKYGGSSLSDAAAVKRVARRIVEAKKSGHDVVVAVSAMGDTTDELLDLAEGVSPLPPARELDMLLTAGERISMALVAMAISDLGFTARSFTGSQAGVITDSVHGKAKIIDVTPGRISAAIDDGHIVIVAGFQGVSQDTKEITTLGRGGTDTTAVALAAALRADVCEIYTDVDGVFTADPRIVPTARKLDARHLRGDARARRLRGEDPAPAVRRVRPPLRHPHPRAVLVQPAGRHRGRGQHQRRGPPGGHHGSRPSSPVSPTTAARPRSPSSAYPTRSARPRASSTRWPRPRSTST